MLLQNVKTEFLATPMFERCGWSSHDSDGFVLADHNVSSNILGLLIMLSSGGKALHDTLSGTTLQITKFLSIH